LNAFTLLNLFHGFLHRCLIQGGLFLTEVTVFFHFNFFRQVRDHIRIGFDAAQDEGADHFSQPLGCFGVGKTFNRQAELPAKSGLGSQKAGIEELHDGP